jgi:hypothetical protein
MTIFFNTFYMYILIFLSWIQKNKWEIN